MIPINAPGPGGYYGKVPARADFVGGRLRHDTIECWDQWLQQALSASQRSLGDAWRARFFAAPIWRFILPGGACGASPLMGILMPSVDSVGRCFPLMIALEIDGLVDPPSLMAGSLRWFAAVEDLALSALGDGFELDDFRRILPGWRSVAAAPATARHNGGGAWMALPFAAAAATAMAAASPVGGQAWPGIWWTAGIDAASGPPGLSPGLVMTEGLIPPDRFAALLDGRWADHGWAVAPAGPAGGDWEWSA